MGKHVQISKLRELSSDEIALVSGGGERRVYMNGEIKVTEFYDDDGWFTGASYDYADGGGSWFNVDGGSGSWTGQTSYWAVGASIGLGFGFWGTGNGDWGIAFNGGIGAYALTGTAESNGAAIVSATPDKIVIGIDNNTTITHIEVDPRNGDVYVPEFGFRIGAFGSTYDPYSVPPEERRPLGPNEHER